MAPPLDERASARPPKTRHLVQVPPAPPMNGRSEVILEHDRVIVAFHLPELSSTQLAVDATARMLRLQSLRPGLNYRCLVALPAQIRAHAYHVTTRNGVLECVFERAREPAV